MPNWCECDLTVKGSPKDLKVFQEFAKSNEELLSANNFIPYPEEFRKQDVLVSELRKKARAEELSEEETKKAWEMKDGYNSGGYQWCITNWGTKWDLNDVNLLSETEESASYTFSTAWSPPVQTIIAMSEKFPTLHFTIKYYECGMGFSGTVKLKGGQYLYQVQNNNYRGHRGG